MGTGQDVRRQIVLDALQKVQPASAKQLADITTLNYHTLRRMCKEMMDKGQIVVVDPRELINSGRPLSDFTGNSVYYCMPNADRMPHIYTKHNNSRGPISNLARAYISRMSPGGKPWPAATAVESIGEVVLDLMWTAKQLNDGNVLQASDAEFEAVMVATRNRLENIISVLESTKGVAEQLLDIKTLWSAPGLQTMINDSNFPSTEEFNEWFKVVSNANQSSIGPPPSTPQEPQNDSELAV